jgi:hypothetical protein
MITTEYLKKFELLKENTLRKDKSATIDEIGTFRTRGRGL